MKHALVVILFSAAGMQAQCCLGAQDVSAESKNGLFKVEAKSTTGTGPDHHGPYDYKFAWFEKDWGGNFVEKNSFEVHYETNNHFNMRVAIPPTGGGFLVDTGISKEVVFYGTSGERERVYDRMELMIKWGESLEESGFYLMLLNSQPKKLGPNAFSYTQDGVLFLPLGVRAKEPLDSQILRFLAMNEEKLDSAWKNLSEWVEKLNDEDPDARDEAYKNLSDNAFLVVGKVQQLSAKSPSEEVKRRLDALVSENAGWLGLGGDRMIYNLVLMLGLLEYPNPKVTDAARSRILDIVSAQHIKNYSTEETRKWLQRNISAMKWNEKTKVYEAK